MDNNFLWGTLPVQFSSLQNLRALWFNSNSLTGSLPSDMAQMTLLASLDFDDNALTGTLPLEFGESLKDLIYLGLRLNAIEGTLPDQWSQGLESLRFLDLEGNQLEGTIPTQLGMVTLLESLYLENNRLEGQLPSELGQLTALRQLFVQDNHGLTGSVPKDFTSLAQLEYFWFHGTNLTGSVDDIFCLIPFVQDLKGDCLLLGDNADDDAPEITCTCCTVCCTADGETCVNN
jgi:Leucine-rich repeat (LRR) protein